MSLDDPCAVAWHSAAITAESSEGQVANCMNPDAAKDVKSLILLGKCGNSSGKLQ